MTSCFGVLSKRANDRLYFTDERLDDLLFEQPEMSSLSCCVCVDLVLISFSVSALLELSTFFFRKFFSTESVHFNFLFLVPSNAV